MLGLCTWQAALCPLLGCGTKPRHRLNAINAFQFLWAEKAKSHLLVCKAHQDHPAVPILIKRYEAAKGDPNMSATRLNEVAGANPLTSEWMAEHAEEVGSDGLRTITSLETTRDLFEADVSTPLARGTWIRRTKEAYIKLLEQRKAERDSGPEAEASRARAAAAMGLDPEEEEQDRGPVLFAELQSLDPTAEDADYLDPDGWDIQGLERDIEIVRRGARVPGT